MSGKRTHDGKIVGMTAAPVATTAAACAVSCMAPFALPALVLISFSGVIAWLTGAYPLISAGALLMVIAAWLGIGCRSYKLKARQRLRCLSPCS